MLLASFVYSAQEARHSVCSNPIFFHRYMYRKKIIYCFGLKMSTWKYFCDSISNVLFLHRKYFRVGCSWASTLLSVAVSMMISLSRALLHLRNRYLSAQTLLTAHYLSRYLVSAKQCMLALVIWKMLKLKRRQIAIWYMMFHKHTVADVDQVELKYMEME